jgi:hypothetical protein
VETKPGRPDRSDQTGREGPGGAGYGRDLLRSPPTLTRFLRVGGVCDEIVTARQEGVRRFRHVFFVTRTRYLSRENAIRQPIALAIRAIISNWGACG